MCSRGSRRCGPRTSRSVLPGATAVPAGGSWSMMPSGCDGSSLQWTVQSRPASLGRRDRVGRGQARPSPERATVPGGAAARRARRRRRADRPAALRPRSSSGTTTKPRPPRRRGEDGERADQRPRAASPRAGRAGGSGAGSWRGRGVAAPRREREAGRSRGGPSGAGTRTTRSCRRRGPTRVSSSAASSARAIAAALWKRGCGSRRSAWRIASSSRLAARRGRQLDGGRDRAGARARRSPPPASRPDTAAGPVSASYRTTPRLKRSLAGRELLAVQLLGRHELERADARVAVALVVRGVRAIPKSISLAGPGPSMTLPDFTSQCTSPCSWTTRSPASSSRPDAQHRLVGRAGRRRRARSRSERCRSSSSITMKCAVAVAAGVVDVDEARVRERGGGASLGQEARGEGRVVGVRRGEHLDRHVAVEAVVARAVHAGHAAARDLRLDPVAIRQPCGRPSRPASASVIASAPLAIAAIAALASSMARQARRRGVRSGAARHVPPRRPRPARSAAPGPPSRASPASAANASAAGLRRRGVPRAVTRR